MVCRFFTQIAFSYHFFSYVAGVRILSGIPQYKNNRSGVPFDNRNGFFIMEFFLYLLP